MDRYILYLKNFYVLYFTTFLTSTTVFIFFNVKLIIYELLYKLKTWFLQCVVEVSKFLSQIIEL